MRHHRLAYVRVASDNGYLAARYTSWPQPLDGLGFDLEQATVDNGRWVPARCLGIMDECGDGVVPSLLDAFGPFLFAANLSVVLRRSAGPLIKYCPAAVLTQLVDQGTA